MKVIIAGGREYHFTLDDIALLDRLHVKYKFTNVISGGAKGADSEGELWAEQNDIPVMRFPAQWKKFGKRAGFIRNNMMAKEGDMLIAFPGGSGTRNMVTQMTKLNKMTVEVGT